MRFKPFIAAALLSAVLIILTAVISSGSSSATDKELSKLCVNTNELINLVEAGDSTGAVQMAQEIDSAAHSVMKNRHSSDRARLWAVCAGAVFIVCCAVTYLWVKLVRPFHKLEVFADSIALGELDLPLEYQRDNYFGKFTWAFDSMRKEILRSRACEREAIDNNKTVIAALSHDLKTPVASISAYSEALVNGLYSDQEEMYSYLEVISSKCEELARLTNDMITHSISELNALKLEPAPVDLVSLIKKAAKEASADGNVNFEEPMFPATVYADESRLTQLVGNLIGNAKKYAGTKLDISIKKIGEEYNVIFRDYGSGIPDKDMPFIFDKFYRGSNCGAAEGSGLGLYIVKYIARRSGGDVFLKNCAPGLEVTVTLPEKNVILKTS